MRRDIDHNPQDRKNKKEKGKKDKTPLVVITHTASMIKGGGYLGASTRQSPTTQTIKKNFEINVGQGGCVP